MKADGNWDPTCHDTDHLSTQELMVQIPTTPVVVTDSFYNQEGDVSDTGSYSSSQASSQVLSKASSQVSTQNQVFHSKYDSKKPVFDLGWASSKNPVSAQNQPCWPIFDIGQASSKHPVSAQNRLWQDGSTVTKSNFDTSTVV